MTKSERARESERERENKWECMCEREADRQTETETGREPETDWQKKSARDTGCTFIFRYLLYHLSNKPTPTLIIFLSLKSLASSRGILNCLKSFNLPSPTWTSFTISYYSPNVEIWNGFYVLFNVQGKKNRKKINWKRFPSLALA